jgi:hypothetical protein
MFAFRFCEFALVKRFFTVKVPFSRMKRSRRGTKGRTFRDCGRESARRPVASTALQGVSIQITLIAVGWNFSGSSPCSDKSALGKTMASDDKKTKTSPAPKNEFAAKKKDEGQPKDKSTSAADPSKAEGGEKAADSPSGYSRGEGQKPVSKAYKDNWNAIYAKKKKR